MSSFFEGGALPNVTETQTAKETAPEWYNKTVTELSDVGQDFLKKTPDQLVAGYDTLQTQGYGKVPGAAGAYQPGLTNATTTANAAAAGITPERLQQLMNPYTQNVVQELARQSGNALQRNIMPQITGGFVGSGALGSSRYAGALGQAMTDVSANLAGEQGKLLASGYNNAVEALLREQQNQTQAGKLQGDLATQAQTLGLNESEALRKAGAERQKYEQQRLESPLITASNVAGLLRGYQVPTDKTQTTVKPGQRGQYGLSDFEKIGTLASLLAGADAQGNIPGFSSAQSKNLRNLVGRGFKSFDDYISDPYRNAGLLGDNGRSVVDTRDVNAPDSWENQGIFQNDRIDTSGWLDTGWGSYGTGDADETGP
jgi:hypothetical protein